MDLLGEDPLVKLSQEAVSCSIPKNQIIPMSGIWKTQLLSSLSLQKGLERQEYL
jgi:hypothetical protein